VVFGRRRVVCAVVVVTAAAAVGLVVVSLCFSETQVPYKRRIKTKKNLLKSAKQLSTSSKFFAVL